MFRVIRVYAASPIGRRPLCVSALLTLLAGEFAFLLRQLELSVGSIASCGDAIVQPASGQCSIQLTFVGCQTCCDIDERLGNLLVPVCDAASRAAGGLVGGWGGSIAGGLAGDLVCTLMMRDTNCYDRCIGKDGDPSPIACFDSADPEETGVCRQVCEAGQHNIGILGCPTNSRAVDQPASRIAGRHRRTGAQSA